LHGEASAVSDDVAVIAKSQTRPDYTMTFRELRDEVRRLGQGLADQGDLGGLRARIRITERGRQVLPNRSNGDDRRRRLHLRNQEFGPAR